LDILNKLEENTETRPIFDIYEKRLHKINQETPNNEYFFIHHFIQKEKVNPRIKRQIRLSIFEDTLWDFLEETSNRECWICSHENI